MPKRKEKAKAKAATTSVTFLLDRSGSMQSIKGDTIGAFNAYLDELKKAKTPIIFSLVTFDTTSIDKVCVREPIANVVPLTNKTYLPRDGTPLIEASIKTIEAVADSLKGDTKTKVVICIQTDGQENASGQEYTWDRLARLIKEKTKLGWQFNFMGASIDAYDQGSRMGIGVANTMSYDSKSRGATMTAFRASASNTAGFASGLSANTSYSTAQKLGSGDTFDPNLNNLNLTAGGSHSVTPNVAVTKKKPVPPAVDTFKL